MLAASGAGGSPSPRVELLATGGRDALRGGTTKAAERRAGGREVLDICSVLSASRTSHRSTASSPPGFQKVWLTPVES